MNSTNLYESLFILHKCNETLKTQSEELKRKIGPDKKGGRQEQITANYIILEACSFLDEFHGSFKANTLEQFKDRIEVVKKMTKPIFKRINKWQHLEKFRNNIVAHPWRDKSNGNKFVIPDLHKYSVPRNWFEYIVLVDLIGYIYDIVVFEFAVEYKEAQAYMATLLPTPKEKSDYGGLVDDLVKMAVEVDEIAKNNNREYDMKITGYEF